MIDNLTLPLRTPAQKTFFCEIVTQIENHFEFSDLVFVATNNPNKIPAMGDNVIVFLSGNERFKIPSYLNMVGLVFSDFFKSSCKNPKIIPFPLGYRNDFIRQTHIPITDRKASVFFSGHIHVETATRRGFKANLDNLHKNIDGVIVNYTTRNGTGIPTEEYLDKTKNAKFSLVPIGKFGHDTFRYFEAIKCGSIPILGGQDYNIWYYADNDGCIKLNSWGELTPQLINNAIQKQEEYYDNLKQFYEAKLSNQALINFAIERIHNHYDK